MSNASDHQIIEFLGGLASCSSEDAVVRLGTELTALALDADVAAFVRGDRIIVGVGGLTRIPDGIVASDTARSQVTIDIDGIGRCVVTAATLDESGDEMVVIGRRGDAGFGPGEIDLLHSLTRALHVSRTTVRMVDDERRRREQSDTQAAENARLLASLQRRQTRDGLTGLANRSLFLERLELAVDRNRRRRTPFALIYLDVDHFKVINDGMGHAAGDELLVEIGERIRSSLRRSDFAGRLGGDEFAVVTEHVADLEQATSVARRLHALFQRPFTVAGKPVVTTASIGVALSDGTSADGAELLRNADVAMYHAKAGGKARIAFFEQDMFAAARERMELEADLRRAIERRELAVYFQPVIDLATHEIRGVEALTRWNHPSRGLLPPDAFIPVAEEVGLITALEHFVLRESLVSVKKIHEQFPSARPFTVSVNISAHRFRDAAAAIVTDVAQALDETGVGAEHLIVEVTESALLDHSETTVAALNALKRMGVRLAIDDFGAGNSSLTYLTLCDFDVLKIDQAFIETMVETPIAAAILAMAKILNLEAVAEGVENVHQAGRLLELGCPLVQGFYFARPLPLARLEEMLLQADDAADSTDVVVPLRLPRTG